MKPTVRTRERSGSSNDTDTRRVGTIRKLEEVLGVGFQSGGLYLYREVDIIARKGTSRVNWLAR